MPCACDTTRHELMGDNRESHETRPFAAPADHRDALRQVQGPPDCDLPAITQLVCTRGVPTGEIGRLLALMHEIDITGCPRCWIRCEGHSSIARKQHHHVYVVELSDEVWNVAAFAGNPTTSWASPLFMWE